VDELLGNQDIINQSTFTPNGTDATALTVATGARFRVGDLVRPTVSREVMLVTAISGNTLTVIRRYGGSPATALGDQVRLVIIGNASLEGDDAPDARFTNRTRKRNFTQIFSASVNVSGTMAATRRAGVQDEIEYQKASRLREMMRELEFSVLLGVAASSNPQGSATVRRTMNGILPQISTHQYVPGAGAMPPGDDDGTALNEAVLNAALRRVWEGSAGRIDTIVVGGALKRRINGFNQSSRRTGPSDDRFRSLVNVYESDFGVCQVVMSRAIPDGQLLLLDSTRVAVLPLAGRSFGFKPLGVRGDRHEGLLVGEYTLELRNEAAHAVIRGLS
jgi:hypothetical protein